MNEEIAKKVIEYIEGSKDFILEQAPGLCQDVITWTIFSRSFIFLLLYVITILIIFYAKKTYLLIEEKEDSESAQMVIALEGIIVFIFVIIQFSAASDLFQAIFCEKLYLLKYFYNFN